MKNDSILFALVLMILVCFAPTSFAADQVFLKIDDVKGEATHDIHQDEIDVLAWSFSGTSSATTHLGAGGGAGTPTVQDLLIVKWIDAATPPILMQMLNGRHFDEAILSVGRAGAKGGAGDYFVITMQNVIVTSVSTGGSVGDDRLTENITLNFASFCVSYTQTAEDGSLIGGPSDACYDIAKGV